MFLWLSAQLQFAASGLCARSMLSVNSSPPMSTCWRAANSSSLAHSSLPLDWCLCVWQLAKSGLPACSHMLFYPSVASGTVGRPPPSILHLLLFHFLADHLSLTLCVPSLPVCSLFLGPLSVCLMGKGGVCLFALLSCSFSSSLTVCFQRRWKERAVAKKLR